MCQTKHEFHDPTALTNMVRASKQMTWNLLKQKNCVSRLTPNQEMHLIRLMAHCAIIKGDFVIY